MSVIVAAVLRIDTEARPPVAELTCHRCGHHHTVRGRAAVQDYVRSNPLHEHRVHCPLVQETPQRHHLAASNDRRRPAA